jgi:hypothetical protein
LVEKHTFSWIASLPPTMVCCQWRVQLVVLVRPVPLLSFTISADSLRKLLPGEFWWSGRFPGALGRSGSLPFTLASGTLSYCALVRGQGLGRWSL